MGEQTTTATMAHALRALKTAALKGVGIDSALYGERTSGLVFHLTSLAEDFGLPRPVVIACWTDPDAQHGEWCFWFA